MGVYRRPCEAFNVLLPIEGQTTSTTAISNPASPIGSSSLGWNIVVESSMQQTASTVSPVYPGHKIYTVPRTWHPHIYEKIPGQPTPHFIADILELGATERPRHVQAMPSPPAALESPSGLHHSLAKHGVKPTAPSPLPSSKGAPLPPDTLSLVSGAGGRVVINGHHHHHHHHHHDLEDNESSRSESPIINVTGDDLMEGRTSGLGKLDIEYCVYSFDPVDVMSLLTTPSCPLHPASWGQALPGFK